MKTENIPQLVVDMATRLYETNESYWSRENSCITLENIRDFCDFHAQKFRRQRETELVKGRKQYR